MGVVGFLRVRHRKKSVSQVFDNINNKNSQKYIPLRTQRWSKCVMSIVLSAECSYLKHSKNIRQILNLRQSNGKNMKMHSLNNLQVTLSLSLKSYKASLKLIQKP